MCAAGAGQSLVTQLHQTIRLYPSPPTLRRANSLLRSTRPHLRGCISCVLRPWMKPLCTYTHGVRHLKIILLTAKYRSVMILNSNGNPTTQHRKNQQYRPWTWKFLFSSTDGLLVLKQAVVLPSGKINAETKRRLRDLPSTFNFRNFVS